MITLLTLSLLSIAPTLSAPAVKCKDQASCFRIETNFDSDADTIDICLYYDNNRDNCKKDDEISYACLDDTEPKVESWNGDDPICHNGVSCDRDLDPEARFVEFGAKDGKGCSVESPTGQDDVTTDIDIVSDVTNVMCRVANRDDPDGVLCEGKQNDECIHRVQYECPTPDTGTGTTTGTGPVDTCDRQAPCFTVGITYPSAGTVKVAVDYDSASPSCRKDDTEGISHICYDGTKREDDENGLLPQESFAIEEDCACAPNNFVEFAGKDGGGCEDPEDTEDPITVTFADGSFQSNERECRAASDGDTASDICGTSDKGGDAKECIYKIYYEGCVSCSANSVLSSKEAHKSIFGVKDASKGEIAGIYSGIVIGGVVFAAFIVGMIWFYVTRMKGERVEKEKEFAENEVDGAVTVSLKTTGSPDDVEGV